MAVTTTKKPAKKPGADGWLESFNESAEEFIKASDELIECLESFKDEGEELKSALEQLSRQEKRSVSEKGRAVQELLKTFEKYGEVLGYFS